MRICDARVTVQPVMEPVSLEEAKLSSRIDLDTEDSFVQMAIVTARQRCEDVSRYAFVTRTYTAKLDRWPYSDTIWLPFPPLQSVTSIVYVDEADAPHTFASSNYVVDIHHIPGRVVLKTTANWPTENLQAGGAITITFVAGYGDADAVPAKYKQAILAYTGAYYENREALLTQPGLTMVALPFVDDWLLTDRAY